LEVQPAANDKVAQEGNDDVTAETAVALDDLDGAA
jgi:hypothetical protein